MTSVVMGERFPSARAGEHQSMFRRRKIESDDVDEFFDELRIVGELEGLGAVRVKLW